MFSVTEIKRKAKTALSGKMLGAVMASCAVIFTVLAGMLASEIFLFSKFSVLLYYVALVLVVLFLVTPIFFGTVSYFIRLCSDETPNPTTVFSAFGSGKNYGRYLQTVFPIGLRCIVVFFLTLLPSTIFNALSNDLFYTQMKQTPPENLKVFAVLSVAFQIAGWIFIVVYLLRYFMVPYLTVNAPEMDPETVLLVSRKLYDRFSTEFLKTVFGFWFWILISILVIPLIFTVPYFMSGYVFSAREAVQLWNQSEQTKIRINETKGEEIP